MPPKTYIQAPPHGDFRAMPAKGAGIAILKWVTSFPGNPAAGLPVVMGAICVSSAADGELLALVDVRAVTALRTGAVAAVAAQELARPDARRWGSWAAGCTAPGRRAASPRPSTGRASASTRTPTRPGGSRASSAGRWAASTTRSPATS